MFPASSKCANKFVPLQKEQAHNIVYLEDPGYKYVFKKCEILHVGQQQDVVEEYHQLNSCLNKLWYILRILVWL